MVDIVEEDLESREVSSEESRELLKEHELNGLSETSVKTGQNVKKVFAELTTMLVKD